MNETLEWIAILIVTILLALVIAIAGSYGTPVVMFGLPLFACGVVLIFIINWLAFIPAFILQTEKFFDLTGTLSYVSVILVGLIMSPVHDLRSLVVTVCILLWAIRLGAFLFTRVLRDGKDARFDAFKPSFLKFLSVWTIQALWVSVTVSAGLVVATSVIKVAADVCLILGLILWVIGFAIEVVADYQKSQWRKTAKNHHKFINVGLWSRSRHPNYFGEIILWFGIALIALPILHSWQFVTLISPIFVTVLLMKVSGIPMLEQRADNKWGGQADYENYKQQTPVLIPKLG